jgi:hypothetical protein
MSNYPTGAEYDSNAPFNRTELQGENVGLFDYILNNSRFPYEATSGLIELEHNLKLAKSTLEDIRKSYLEEDRPAAANLILNIQRLLNEPQIFIENE